jgi:hypothetical protein
MIGYDSFGLCAGKSPFSGLESKKNPIMINHKESAFICVEFGSVVKFEGDSDPDPD